MWFFFFFFNMSMSQWWTHHVGSQTEYLFVQVCNPCVCEDVCVTEWNRDQKVNKRESAILSGVLSSGPNDEFSTVAEEVTTPLYTGHTLMLRVYGSIRPVEVWLCTVDYVHSVCVCVYVRKKTFYILLVIVTVWVDWNYSENNLFLQLYYRLLFI